MTGDHMHFGRVYFSIPIYFFNDEFDCGKVNLMAKLEFDNGPEHSVRCKAFIFAHQFIRSFNRFSVEDFRFSMNIDSTMKKFVLNENAMAAQGWLRRILAARSCAKARFGPILGCIFFELDY